MIEIRLVKGHWSFDENSRLGPPGGFGEVFKGTGGGIDVAVKRLKLTAREAAFRELKISEVLGERKLDHVVPVLDCGQDAETDRYFIVMPICEYSLQEKLKPHIPLSTVDLCCIAGEIISGLMEVDDIVHRDLKPGNILYRKGKWILADFGISKFVEDSTSIQTLRGCLTPAYAAPEQWRGERPTHATDVYSLGCIVYEMATGEILFHQENDLRSAHLHSIPPQLQDKNSRFVAFVSQMLRKSPDARPSLARCRDIFKDLSFKDENEIHPVLAEAAKSVASVAAKADADRIAIEKRRSERNILIGDARDEFLNIKSALLKDIVNVSDEAKIRGDVIEFGSGSLAFGHPLDLGGTDDGAPNLLQCKWDVCIYSQISVRCYVPSKNHDYTFSASLAYSRTPEDTNYRWREISFWTFGAQTSPFFVAPNSSDFDLALSKILCLINVAYGPWPIDGEDEENFRRRGEYS